jgi:hypothetical protein
VSFITGTGTVRPLAQLEAVLVVTEVVPTPTVFARRPWSLLVDRPLATVGGGSTVSFITGTGTVRPLAQLEAVLVVTEVVPTPTVFACRPWSRSFSFPFPWLQSFCGM